MLGCIRWEAVIVDECQHSVISLHMEHIKVLHADRRLLVVNGQLKVCFMDFFFLWIIICVHIYISICPCMWLLFF